ncbi:MAG: hypothetical protein WC718_17820, partial [Phycisphaerales bacterium]
NPKCKHTLAEFGQYQYARSAENHPISELPIDTSNHSMKCIAYYLYDKYGAVRPRQVRVGVDRTVLTRPAMSEVDMVVRAGKINFRRVPQKAGGRVLSFTRDEE